LVVIILNSFTRRAEQFLPELSALGDRVQL